MPAATPSPACASALHVRKPRTAKQTASAVTTGAAAKTASCDRSAPLGPQVQCFLAGNRRHSSCVMDRGTRIRGDKRQRASQAFERWKGFQPNLREIRGAQANRDGSIPRPRVGVLTFEQRARFAERERLREVIESPVYRNARITAERMIGATLDFTDLAPNEQARKAGRPVVRIVTLNGNGFVPEGFASGFLISPDLILTNHHVFRTPDEAEGIGAQFLFERTEEGLREGLIFELEPARFFVNDKRLDYAVVAVRPRATGGAELQQFRFLPLIGVKGKILK